MLRFPKKTKYKYSFNRTSSNKSTKGLQQTPRTTSLIIKSKENYFLTPKQLEAARRIFARPIRAKHGFLNIKFFPNLSLSKKPLQTRMGKGKGRPNRWVSPKKAGSPLFEIGGRAPLKLVKRLYKRVAFRLPVFSKMLLKRKHKKSIPNKLSIRIKEKHDL